MLNNLRYTRPKKYYTESELEGFPTPYLRSLARKRCGVGAGLDRRNEQYVLYDVYTGLSIGCCSSNYESNLRSELIALILEENEASD